jgi:CBS-domain-containing membrane protein
MNRIHAFRQKLRLFTRQGHHVLKPLSQIIGVELSPVSTKEKLVSGLGGFVAILLILLVTGSVLDLSQAQGLVASMGASAVLLFAVPHGQLSQPWPVIAGHGFSALIGVGCQKWIASPVLAAACAVGIAISVMYQLKCIHPPGGATALTAVAGGEAVHALGFQFVLLPVLTNATLIVAVAILFNFAFQWRRYPRALAHNAAPHIPDKTTPSHDEVVAAMRHLDSFVDISEDDLLELIDILAEDSPLKRYRSGNFN